MTSATNEVSLKGKGSDALHQGLGGSGGMSFIEENAKIFVALAIVAVLAVLGYVGFQFVEKRQERASQEAYYAVESKYLKLRDGFDKAKFEALMPGMAPKDDKQSGNAKAKAASGNIEQDYGSVLPELEKVARDHAGTAGGAQAAILAAETYLSYNQFDKAAELAQIPAKNMPAKHILAGLSKTLWGNALAAKGDCQGAIGTWQEVLDTKTAGFLHPEVSLRAGICFENLNQPDKAAEMYRKVSADAPESAAGSQAKALLRALELKGKQQPAKQG